MSQYVIGALSFLTLRVGTVLTLDDPLSILASIAVAALVGWSSGYFRSVLTQTVYAQMRGVRQGWASLDHYKSDTLLLLVGGGVVMLGAAALIVVAIDFGFLRQLSAASALVCLLLVAVPFVGACLYWRDKLLPLIIVDFSVRNQPSDLETKDNTSPGDAAGERKLPSAYRAPNSRL